MVTSRERPAGVRDVEAALENSSCRLARPPRSMGCRGTLIESAGRVVANDRNAHGTVQTQLARHTCYVAKPQVDAKTWYAISCHTSASTIEAASMCCRAEDRRTHS
jgi:hypothetical protein